MQPMTTLEHVRCVELESASRLMRSRERSLQHLAQSPRCASRPQAERELGLVREKLAALYVQMRQLHPNA